MPRAAMTRWHSGPRALRITVGLLIILGLTVAIARGFVTIERLASSRPVTELTGFDRLSAVVLAALIGAEEGSATFHEAEEQTWRMLRKFNRHPTATLLHVLPAAAFLILVPLQLSRRFRSRHLAWHRWAGRIVIALAIPIGISGLFFGVLMPFGGIVEASAIALFGTWFLFALIRGYISIRTGRVERHREWMIRMFSVALGVSVQRLVAGVLALGTRALPAEWFGQSLWIGFTLSVVIAEIWIRGTRRPSERERAEGIRAFDPPTGDAGEAPPM